VKTPNAVAAVRGTVFVVEVIRASDSASKAQGGITVNHYVFGGQIALSVGTQIVPVGANNFASVTGGLVSSGIMSAAMRVSAGSGFAPSSLPKVDGAEDEAKQAVINSTVATFSAASLFFIVPPTPPPPTIPPRLLTTERASAARRYGVRIYSAAGGDRCRRAAPAVFPSASATVTASSSVPATTEPLSRAAQIAAGFTDEN